MKVCASYALLSSSVIITFCRSTTGSRNLSKVSLLLSIYTSFSWQFTKYLHSNQPLSSLFCRKIKSSCFPIRQFLNPCYRFDLSSGLNAGASYNSFMWDIHQGHRLCRRDEIQTSVQN